VHYYDAIMHYNGATCTTLEHKRLVIYNNLENDSIQFIRVIIGTIRAI